MHSKFRKAEEHNSEKYIRRSVRRRIWKRIVSVLACAVVFCTTYALILPAITVENECQLQEHTHTESCYVLTSPTTEQRLVCTQPEVIVHTHTDACYAVTEPVVHTHSESCYTFTRDDLLCAELETAGHTHTDACYTITGGELTCTEAEAAGHTHTDACYTTTAGGTCTETESAGHTHTAACYTITGGELTCTETEAVGHSHTDACYTITGGELTCTETEAAGHTHTDACYTLQPGELICTESEVAAHTHGDACYTTTPAVVHNHSDACYTQQTGGVICGAEESEEHTHSAGCYETVSVLACGMEDGAVISEASTVLSCMQEETAGHAHTDACYGEATAVLSCTQEEAAGHTHTTACYGEATTTLICTQEEAAGHTHTAACYGEATTTLICTQEEAAGHTHTAACQGEATTVLTCTQEESAGHTHSVVCYNGGTLVLSCTQEEVEGHTHTDACYTMKSVLTCTVAEGTVEKEGTSTLICTLQETVEHTHSDTCRNENGELICGLEEIVAHTHNEQCYETVALELPLTCTQAESEEHTHGALCYGTWQLVCTIPEHSHADHYQPESELTDTQKMQIRYVESLIKALPEYEEIEAKMAAYEAAGDMEGEEAYLLAVINQCKYAYDAYSSMPEALQLHVTNSAKLMDLSWLWGMETFSSDGGELTIDLLNEDAVYVSDVTLLSTKTGQAALDDESYSGVDGYDVSYEDSLLRTYDIVSYDVQFTAKIHENIRKRNIIAYKQGRAFFEFVLPAQEDEARFEIDAMPWLKESGTYYQTVTQTVNGTTWQILRGSYMLTPPASSDAALGESSTHQRTVAVRALRMKNGETIQPEFTFWMHYNDVMPGEDLYYTSNGTTLASSATDHAIPANVVTGTGYECRKDHSATGDAVGYIDGFTYTTAAGVTTHYADLYDAYQALVFDPANSPTSTITMYEDVTFGTGAGQVSQLGTYASGLFTPGFNGVDYSFTLDMNGHSMTLDPGLTINNDGNNPALVYFNSDSTVKIMDGEIIWPGNRRVFALGLSPTDANPDRNETSPTLLLENVRVNNSPASPGNNEAIYVYSTGAHITLSGCEFITSGDDCIRYRVGAGGTLTLQGGTEITSTTGTPILLDATTSTPTISFGEGGAVLYSNQSARYSFVKRGNTYYTAESHTCLQDEGWVVAETVAAGGLYRHVVNETGAYESLLEEITPAVALGSPTHEFATAQANEVTITARISIDFALRSGRGYDDSAITDVDFSPYVVGVEETMIANMFNTDKGTVYGRLMGQGASLRVAGTEGKGLLGIQIPEEGDWLEFDLTLSGTCTFTDENDKSQTGAYAAFAPLFFSGDVNDSAARSSWDGRDTAQYVTRSYQANVPFGSKPDRTYWNRSCYDGGAWEFTPVYNADGSLDPNKVHVTVRNFVLPTHLGSVKSDFDLAGLAWQNSYAGDYYNYPHAYPSQGTSAIEYYDPAVVTEYWQINDLYFSAGELWFVQPYESLMEAENPYGTVMEAGTSFVDYFGTSGQTHLKVKLSNAVYNGAAVEQPSNNDSLAVSYQLTNPGSVAAYITYNEYKQASYERPLTPGCQSSDADWAPAGTPVTLKSWINHDGSELGYQAVAYDNMIKFDSSFFVPDDSTSYRIQHGEYGGNVTYDETLGYGVMDSGQHCQVLWGVLKDGSELADENGNYKDVESMKKATADDMDFYNSHAYSYEEIIAAAGKKPVAALFEIRGMPKDPQETNHYNFMLHGYIDPECPPGRVYMITRNSFLWTKATVFDGALAYWKEQDPTITTDNVSGLTDAQYSEYAQKYIPTRDPAAYEEGTPVPTVYDENHGESLAYYPKMAWRQDYYFASQTSSKWYTGVSTSTLSSGCQPATYDAQGYHAGVGGGGRQDSCLVTALRFGLTHETAQSTDSGARSFYDVTQGQVVVDYKITPSVTALSSGAEYTLIVKQTLPDGLIYRPNSAWRGGEYTQDESCQTPGTFVGGEAMEPTIDPATNTLSWEFTVSDTGGTGMVSLEPIYFSCDIDESVVEHNSQLTTTATVEVKGYHNASFSVDNGNLASFNITVYDTGSTSVTKQADQRIVDSHEARKFTMTYSNGALNADVLLVEALPYNGVNGSKFSGSIELTEFSAQIEGADGGVQSFDNTWTFYYTTSTAYAGATSKALASEDFTNTEIWTPVSVKLKTDQSGKYAYVFTLADGTTAFPSGVTQTAADQITAIAVKGTMPAGTTIYLHVGFVVNGGLPEDYLVNYLTQGTLSSFAWTQAVSRTLEGRVWMDVNQNGLQDIEEESVGGVLVTLRKLKADGNQTVFSDYEAVYFPDTTTPVQTTTGFEVDTQDPSSSSSVSDPGYYKFTSVEAGTYAVLFTDPTTGEEIIKPYRVTAANKGSDDTIDSDAGGVYSDDTLYLTQGRILGIVQPATADLTYGVHRSMHHDMGLHPMGTELPETGGPGTQWYTLGGILLLCAAVFLLYKKSRQGKEERGYSN